LLAALVVFVWGCSGSGKGDVKKGPDPAEESAAVAIRTFLDALKNQDGSSAYALLSKDYRERLPEEERKAKSLNVNLAGGEPVAAYRYGQGTMSESKQQAAFLGELFRKDGKQFGFTLILAKDKESDSWKVDVFTVQK
jgi:hypothetical protein